MEQITKQIIGFAIQTLGFDDCRIADPFLDDYLDEYRGWLKNGLHADMDYLERHLPFKENPKTLLEDVVSAIVLIKNYKNTTKQFSDQPVKVARYAAGRDYHLVISEKLELLTGLISAVEPEAKFYFGVDSRPLADRSLALKSGIGFRGKNTMVIKPGLGSYFFIGIILTNLDLKKDRPLKWDCGNCRLCLDACPTNALTNSFELDAAKCISYQTIEQKTEMTDEQLSRSKGWLFGCDICQEVCPYNNQNVPLTTWEDFKADRGVGFDGLNDINNIVIPKDSAMYRSRKRLFPNVENARKGQSTIPSP